MLSRKLDVEAVAIATLVVEVAVRRPCIGDDLDLVRVDYALRARGFFNGVLVDAVVEVGRAVRPDMPVNAELVVTGGHGVVYRGWLRVSISIVGQTSDNEMTNLMIER